MTMTDTVLPLSSRAHELWVHEDLGRLLSISRNTSTYLFCICFGESWSVGAALSHVMAFVFTVGLRLKILGQVLWCVCM